MKQTAQLPTDICPCRDITGSDTEIWEGYADEHFTAITGHLYPTGWRDDPDVATLVYHLLRCRTWVDAPIAARLWGCSIEDAGEKLAGISRAAMEWSDDGRERIMVPVPSTEHTPYPAYALIRELHMISRLSRDPVVALRVERNWHRNPSRRYLALEWAERWGSISAKEAAIAAYCDRRKAAELLRELSKDREWEKVVTGPGRRVRYFLPGHSGPLAASKFDTAAGNEQDSNEDRLLGTRRRQRSNSLGLCRLCNRSFSRLGIASHITSCRIRTVGREWGLPDRGNDDMVRSYHLEMWDGNDPDFWMHLEIATHLRLETLDEFMRQDWMECCEHLSRFTVNGEKYDSHLFDNDPASPMTVALGEVAGITKEPFLYEFDFGSTSSARMKVVSSGWSKWPGIRILARNDLSFYSCDTCGENASTIRFSDDKDTGEERRELLCDADKHPRRAGR